VKVAVLAYVDPSEETSKFEFGAVAVMLAERLLPPTVKVCAVEAVP